MDVDCEVIESGAAIPYPDLALGARHRFLLPAGAMSDGTTVGLPVLVVVGHVRWPRLVCVAGIHGNEPEGITALLELWDEIDPGELQGTLVLVPVANPPAFRAGERRNPHDGLDMNRIFPGSATGTITERLAHRLYEDVMVGADFALTLHGWSRGGMVTPYVEYPRAGEASTASRAAAMAFGLDWIEAFDWPPGMLAAVCARNGVPAIEPEIGGLECTLPERRSLYKRGVRNLMRHLGLLAGTPEFERAAQEVTRAEVTAPTGGVIRRLREIGDPVEAGDPVATIGDLLGRPLVDVRAPMAGCIAAQRLAAAVSPGEQIAVIFHAEEEES